MFAWRQVFDAIGEFDEKFLSGGDLEWGRRAAAAGFAIGYAQNALVYHPARKSVGKLAAKAKRVCSGYIRIHDADFKKNPANALYHGLCMIKPPIAAGKTIFACKEIPLPDRVVLYFLEYLLKLVQFSAYVNYQIREF